MPPYVIDDPFARRISRLEHSHQNAVKRKLLVRRRNVLDAAQDLRCGLKRERFALQRYNHMLARAEHFASYGAESGRSIDYHYVASRACRLEELGENLGLGDELLVSSVIGLVGYRTGKYRS